MRWLLVAFCFLLGSTPAKCTASGGEVLPPTRIVSEPWGIAVDREGVLRADFQWSGAQLSLYLDAHTMGELARFPDHVGSQPGDTPSTSSLASSLQGLAKGHASLESQSFVVRDPGGRVRWSATAVAGDARPDGSALIVEYQNPNSRVCDLSPEGAARWCREVPLLQSFPGIRVHAMAAGGGVLTWMPTQFIPTVSAPMFAARIQPDGELLWTRQVADAERPIVADTALVENDLIIVTKGPAGPEIQRLRGSDGLPRWKRTPAPPLTGIAISQWQADGDGVWLLWADARGAFALERVGSTGAREQYRRTPPMQFPRMQTFPGSGLGIYGDYRAGPGAELCWYGVDGAFRWRTRFEADTRVHELRVIDRNDVLVATSRGRNATVSELHQLSMQNGQHQRKLTLDRWPIQPHFVRSSIQVGDELWQLATTRSLDETVLVRATAGGIRYRPLGQAFYSPLIPIDGTGPAHTAALLRTIDGLTALDAHGQIAWRLSTPSSFENRAVRLLDNGQLSVLFSSGVGDELRSERWRIEDQTGVVLQRDALPSEFSADTLTPIRHYADGSAVIVRRNAVLRLLPDGRVRETARLQTEPGWDWLARWPGPGGTLLAQYYQFGAPQSPAGGYPIVMIDATGLPRWRRHSVHEPGPVIALGNRMFTVLSDQTTARVAELRPSDGEVLRLFEPPAGLSPGHGIVAADDRIEYLAIERAAAPTGIVHQFSVLSVDPDSGHGSRVGSLLPRGSNAYIWRGPQTRHVRVERDGRVWVISESRQ